MYKQFRAMLVEMLVQPLCLCLLFFVRLFVVFFIWFAWIAFFTAVFMPFMLLFPGVLIFPLLYGASLVYGSVFCLYSTLHSLENKGFFDEPPLPNWLRGDG
jgi:hypothetical protein